MVALTNPPLSAQEIQEYITKHASQNVTCDAVDPLLFVLERLKLEPNMQVRHVSSGEELGKWEREEFPVPHDLNTRSKAELDSLEMAVKSLVPEGVDASGVFELSAIEGYGDSINVLLRVNQDVLNHARSAPFPGVKNTTHTRSHGSSPDQQLT